MKSATLKKAFKEYQYKYRPDNPLFCDDQTLFIKICYEYNQLMSKLLIEQGYSKMTGHGLGNHWITKFKLGKKRLPDFGLYRKTGEKKPHANMHTNDYSARWHWNKANLLVKNSDLYNFKSTRTNIILNSLEYLLVDYHLIQQHN